RVCPYDVVKGDAVDLLDHLFAKVDKEIVHRVRLKKAAAKHATLPVFPTTDAAAYCTVNARFQRREPPRLPFQRGHWTGRYVPAGRRAGPEAGALSPRRGF